MPFNDSKLDYMPLARFLWDELASPLVAPGLPFEAGLTAMVRGVQDLKANPEHNTTAAEALPAMLIQMAVALRESPELVQRLTLLAATKEPGNASEESH